ncbi:hypothetical protein D3C83_85760 [compost metagenome]
MHRRCPASRFLLRERVGAIPLPVSIVPQGLQQAADPPGRNLRGKRPLELTEVHEGILGQKGLFVTRARRIGAAARAVDFWYAWTS